VRAPAARTPARERSDRSSDEEVGGRLIAAPGFGFPPQP